VRVGRDCLSSPTVKYELARDLNPDPSITESEALPAELQHTPALRDRPGARLKRNHVL